MAKPESTFIGSVHKHLPASLYRIKNNNMYNSGQPDCWYSGNKSDLWVEYKFVVVPKLDLTLIIPSLSELQRNWLVSRHDEGRKVAVIIGCKEGGVWLPGIAWNRNFSAGEFRFKTETRATLAARLETAVNI